MTIKLALLKSGEDIISDVSEMTIGEDEDLRVVGYYLTKPCVVKLIKPTMDSQDNMGIDVSLYPWMPLTPQEKIPIPSDWLVTMVEPNASLKQMYIKDVIDYGKDNQSFSVDEQSDSDQSD